MHAYANSKAHCTADWGQILINQLFALPSSKTQTAQSQTWSRAELKCYCQRSYKRWLDKIIYKTEMMFWAVGAAEKKKLPTAISTGCITLKCAIVNDSEGQKDQ